MIYLISDFDGTIANTLDLSLDIANDYVDDFGLPHFTADQLEKARSSNLLDLLRDHGFSRSQVALAVLAFQKKLYAHRDKLKPIDGVREAYIELSKDFGHGIISSNNEAIIVEFLQRYGMSIFSPIMGGASLLGKAYKIRSLIKSKGLSKSNVYYVGDEVRDVEAARKVGVGIVSVTWGFNDREALERAAPDHIVDTPEELVKLMYSLNGDQRE